MFHVKQFLILLSVNAAVHYNLYVSSTDLRFNYQYI